MLLGADVSHWNDTKKFDYKSQQFVIIKGTEGKTYQDPTAGEHFRKAKVYTNMIGLYHYARPENNTPQEEANNFVSYFNKFNSSLFEKMCALDVEGTALKVSGIDEWCLKWLNIVRDLTNTTPCIYVQASSAKLFPKVAKAGYPLWLAWYNGQYDVPSNKYQIPWDSVAIHQYTSSPYDKNVFFGNEEAWNDLFFKGNTKNTNSNTVEDSFTAVKLLGELEALANKYRTIYAERGKQE